MTVRSRARTSARKRLGSRPLGRGVVIAVVALLFIAACSDSEEPATTSTTAGPTLPFAAPSKDELGAATGIEFPDSLAEYRSVQLGPSQLDVTFTIPAGDLAAFVDGSALGPLLEGERVMAHSSPLWELNPDEAIRGAESERDGYLRSVEVLGDGDPLVVRLTVRPA